MMNDLHLATTPTRDPRIFDTRWMTGLLQKGRVRVTLPKLDDGCTAAELAAVQYLLTVKNICGHNKAGAGLRLYVSCETIHELVAGTSPKGYLAAYANFLRTRFLGAELHQRSAPYDWDDELCESHVDHLEVDKPAMTLIDVSGVGQVEVTAHAVEKYLASFERKPEKAWRELMRIARDAEPAVRVGRKVIHEVKHRRAARYAMDSKGGADLIRPRLCIWYNWIFSRTQVAADGADELFPVGVRGQEAGDAAGEVSGGHGACGAVARVGGGDCAALPKGPARAAAGRTGADAAGVFRAAVVWPVRRGSRGRHHRQPGAARLCRHRSGARSGTRRHHLAAVSPPARAARSDQDTVRDDQREAIGAGAVDARRHDRRCHHPGRAALGQEQGQGPRSGHASDQERQPVVLRHEGPHRGGC